MYLYSTIGVYATSQAYRPVPHYYKQLKLVIVLKVLNVQYLEEILSLKKIYNH